MSHDPENRPGQQEFGDLASQVADKTKAEQITTLDGRVTTLEQVPTGSDLSPASEASTGDTWAGKSVYRQHFSGSSLANDTTLVTGVDRITAGYGSVNSGGVSHVLSHYNDGTNRLSFHVSAGNLKTIVSGSFLSQEYLFTVEYTKL